MGLNISSSISFMIVGHTKFEADCFFGLLKRKFSECSWAGVTFSNLYGTSQL